ncbi:MAG: hypothetical protein SGARI_007452 [Bacillariaceae sp.]
MSRKIKGGDESAAAGSGSDTSALFSNGPLNSTTMTSSILLAPTPSMASVAPLSIKNFESLEDVRLQKRTSMSLTNIDPLDFNMPQQLQQQQHIYDPSLHFPLDKRGSATVDTSKPAAASVEQLQAAAEDLSELMMEPRSIEQMCAQPLMDLNEIFGTSGSDQQQHHTEV